MYQIKLLGDSSFYLQGPGVSGAVRGATYAAGAGEGETLVDAVDVVLEGTPEAIEAGLAAVEGMLRQAEAARGLPGSMPVYLCCTVTAGGQSWRSPVLGGWIESGPTGADGRAAGAQAVRVRVRRANFWEWEQPRVTYLENPNGSSGEGAEAVPVLVTNHQDATWNHINYIYEGGAEHERGICERAPLRVEMALSDPANRRPVTVIAGHWVYGGLAPVGLVIQGEGGVPRGSAAGTMVNDAGCAGGQYLRVDWSGSAEGELWAGAVPGYAASLMNLPFRVLLRVAGGGLPAAEQVWYRWRAYLVDADGAEHLLGESAGMAMETASECILGPVMHLPPWAVADETQTPVLRLVLVGQAAGAGAHSLKLDFLQLLPLDGWRIYRPLDDQRTLKIIDDGLAAVDLPGVAPCRVYNDYGWQSHAVEGPGLDLRPGVSSMFVFVLLRHEVDKVTWPVDLGLAVCMYHRPRRRWV